MRWVPAALAVLLLLGSVLAQSRPALVWPAPSGCMTRFPSNNAELTEYIDEYCPGANFRSAYVQKMGSTNSTAYWYGYVEGAGSPWTTDNLMLGTNSSSQCVALYPTITATTTTLWNEWLDTVGLCVVPEPEPDPDPLEPGAGWDCDTYNDGSQFCWKYEDDIWHVSWQTPCGAFYGETMDPSEGEQWAADFDASRDEDCTNPLPADPEGVECIGADGLACESTLQEVLYELRMMRHAEATPPVQPPVHEIELDLGEVTVPSFDRDEPSWEGWVEPDFTELEQDTLTARVQSGVLELRSLAETKFPFGMVTWVPTGDVAGAGTCDDPQIALMGTDARGIGWCDSAMELFLAGFGRAALAVLMTIGFGFGVVRTVSLS